MKYCKEYTRLTVQFMARENRQLLRLGKIAQRKALHFSKTQGIDMHEVSVTENEQTNKRVS